MNSIIEKTYELIDVLEGSDLIKDIGIYKEKIESNRELSDLIKKGNSINDDYIILDIKSKLYKNSDYKNYMDKYNELMYIIMDINYRYSKLLGEGSCFK